MTDDLKGKLSDDEKAALRVAAAREFLACLEGSSGHEKLQAAFACLLVETGPPYDYACAAFTMVASLCVRDEGRRVDVHVLSPNKTQVHMSDGARSVLRTYQHEQLDDNIERQPEPTLQ